MRIPAGRARRSRALSLLECLTYIVLFAVVGGVAFSAYYRLDEHWRGFSRNTSDIVKAMQAGERWREDVRRATALPSIENESVFRIMQKGGEVRYLFRDGAIWRQTDDQPAPVRILANVKSSTVGADARRQVTAWRWELELKTRRADATVRPLFTFVAASGTEVAR